MKKDQTMASPSSKDLYEFSWEDWVIKWWSWAVAEQKSRDPLTDRTGGFSALNQPDNDVWFLAGTLGETDFVRSVSVPSGRALFFPIINVLTCTPEGFGGDVKPVTDRLYRTSAGQTIENDAKDDIDHVTRAEVNYSGSVLEYARDRVVTRRFKVTFPQNPPLGRREGEATCVSDGYWVFTDPLSNTGGNKRGGNSAAVEILGEHSFLGADGNAHSFRTGVRYEISIT
jgi:hypothetical protein